MGLENNGVFDTILKNGIHRNLKEVSQQYGRFRTKKTNTETREAEPKYANIYLSPSNAVFYVEKQKDFAGRITELNIFGRKLEGQKIKIDILPDNNATELEIPRIVEDTMRIFRTPYMTNIFGFYTKGGNGENAVNQHLEIDGVKGLLNAYGAKVGKNNAGYNALMVNDSHITNVFGAWTDYGVADYNRVLISATKVDKVIAGGVSKYGNVSRNSVKVAESEIKGEAVIAGGIGHNNAENNGVLLENDLLHYESIISGGIGGKSAENNTAGLKGIKIEDRKVEIYGGYVGNNDEDIHNRNLKNIPGMDSLERGVVKNNNLVVSDVESRYPDNLIICGGNNEKGPANNNTVTLNNYTERFIRDRNTTVYGGKGKSTADNNTVNISGKISVGAIYGGMARKVSGNTLNVYTKDAQIKKLDHFDNYNFFVTDNIKKGDTFIYNEEPVHLNEEMSIGVSMNVKPGTFAEGDRFVLIQSVEVGSFKTKQIFNHKMPQNYVMEVSVEVSSLIATVHIVK